jgi:hypothetical protein
MPVDHGVLTSAQNHQPNVPFPVAVVTMSSDSDEDVTESSIYDLDHAPPPPTDATWSGRIRRGESLSPRSGKARKSITLPLGDSLSLASSSQSREPPSTFAGRRGFSSFPGSKPFSLGSKDTSNTSSSKPARRRAYSTPSATTSSSAFTSFSLSPVRTFPPDGKVQTDRKVAFAEDRGGSPLQAGMLHMPEMEEVKEEEEDASKEIALSGTEIDEVKLKYSRSDSPSTSRWSDYEHQGEDGMEEAEGVDSDDLSSDATAPPQPVTFLGFELPMWFSKRRISWNRKCSLSKQYYTLVMLSRWNRQQANPFPPMRLACNRLGLLSTVFFFIDRGCRVCRRQGPVLYLHAKATKYLSIRASPTKYLMRALCDRAGRFCSLVLYYNEKPFYC